MTVLLFQSRFAKPILSGQKRQTIRPHRKRPIQIGQWLSCRQWFDKAYRSMQVEILEVKCSATLEIFISENDSIAIQGGMLLCTTQALDEFAHSDGFDSWSEMRAYLTAPGGYGLPFRGVLIQWEVPDA